jgi:hypothetical protein
MDRVRSFQTSAGGFTRFPKLLRESDTFVSADGQSSSTVISNDQNLEQGEQPLSYVFPIRVAYQLYLQF